MQEAVAYNTTKPRIGDLQIQNEEKWWTDMKPFALDYTLGVQPTLPNQCLHPEPIFLTWQNLIWHNSATDNKNGESYWWDFYTQQWKKAFINTLTK